MSPPLVVYVAGPFGAPTPWGVELNVRLAEEVALKVALVGHYPLCPHAMYRNYDGTRPYEFWIAATLELLKRCDSVLLVDGWERSRGAIGERDYAIAHGMPVHCSISDLPGVTT
jgi:hypothetical protein